MKGRAPLIVALALGILAAFLYWLDLSNAKKEAREGWELQPVIVANQDIDEGTTLSAEMISQRTIPKQFITSSVIQVENYHFILGQKVVVALKRGDTLLWTQFESSKGLERLSKAVQKSFRAITLPAGDKDAVGGFIRPNDHVDILMTFHDGAGGKASTLTILENMLVLATGKITGTTNVNLLPESERSYSNVTLLVLPEEAEMLSLAQDVGHVSLSLRNPEDLEAQPAHEKTTYDTLMTRVRESTLRAERVKAQGAIQVLSGGH